MKIKKLKTFILILLFAVLMVSVDAGASENKAGMEVLSVKEPVRLYASKSSFDTKKYTTIEAAADSVRAQVVNHSPKVIVYFKTTVQSPTEAYKKFKQELTKETDNSSEGDYLYWDIKSAVPQYICVPISDSGTIYYYYRFNISYQYYTTLAQKKQADTKVKSIINSFGFTADTSDYKKIKVIYDYVCANVQYASDIDNDIVYSSYSALFQGEAVCQGYAQLIYKMLKEVNVSVRLIPGYANGELHGWNIVKIGKYYYNIDATWDSLNYHNGRAYQYFLIGDAFANHIRFSDYQTNAFYNLYPMAKSDYGKGTATLSVKSKRAQFRCIKPKIIRIKGKRIRLKKVGSGVKYIIQYSTKSNFKSAKKVVTKKRNIKLSKLKKNKKYYVRFRASKVINGKTVYTKWSSKKTIKIKS